MWKLLENDLKSVCSVHSIDLPGFGNNNAVVETIEAIAHFVFNEMDNLGINKATILGHSMGGYVGLEMLNQYPARIEGLGLIHSHAMADDEETINKRRKQIKFLERNDAIHFLKPFSQQLLGESNRSNEDLLNQTLNLVKETNTKGIVSALKAMINRTDKTNLLGQTAVPILWLVGEEDSFIDHDAVLKQAASTNKAMLEIVKGAGHVSIFERPKESANIIKDFLKWVYVATSEPDRQ